MTDPDDFVFSAGDAALTELPEILMFGDTHHRIAEPQLRPHYNAGIEFCLSRSGIYRWDVEGAPVEIRKGELSVTRPWQLHSGQDNLLGPGRLMWLVIATGSPGSFSFTGRLCEILGNESEEILRAFSGTSTAFLGDLPPGAEAMERIGLELRSARLGRATRVRSLLAQLLVEVARRLDDETIKEVPAHNAMIPDRVLEVLREVTEAPAEPWTAAGMAAQAEMGLTAFTEWCRKATGRSPRWYVLEQRLRVGRQALGTSGRSITDIAIEAGFSSSQHFASAFRKLHGESPSSYRSRTRDQDGSSGLKV